MTAPDLGSVANIITILALPPQLFQLCSGYLFNPTPGPISYYSPIFHLSTSLISLFAPASTPLHHARARSDRPPGRLPHQKASTARLSSPPMSGGPMSSSLKLVTDFHHLVEPPLSSLTCTQVPISPRGSHFQGSLHNYAYIHHPHACPPPCSSQQANYSPAGPE